MNRKNYKNKNKKVKNINNVDVEISMPDDVDLTIGNPAGIWYIDLSSKELTFLAENMNGVETFNLSLYKRDDKDYTTLQKDWIYQSTKEYNIDTNHNGNMTIDDFELLTIGYYKLMVGTQITDHFTHELSGVNDWITFEVTGERFFNDLKLREGWNLVSTITDKPCKIVDDDNIIEGSIYNFSTLLGYIEITNLKLFPSMGYWIKSKSNGTIRLISDTEDENLKCISKANLVIQDIQAAAQTSIPAISKSKDIIKYIMSCDSDSSQNIQDKFKELANLFQTATTTIINSKNNIQDGDIDILQCALHKVATGCAGSLKFDSDFSTLTSKYSNDSCDGDDGDDDGNCNGGDDDDYDDDGGA